VSVRESAAGSGSLATAATILRGVAEVARLPTAGPILETTNSANYRARTVPVVPLHHWRLVQPLLRRSEFMRTAIGFTFVLVALLAAVEPAPAAVGEQGYIGIQIKKNDNGDGILVVAAVAASPADMA